MRRAFFLLAVIAAALLIVIPSAILLTTSSDQKSDGLYQVGSYDSLLGGDYASISKVTALMDNGDFGIGTFTGLDGEMIVLGGTCYRATVDGNVERANDSATTPFAQVNYFDRDGHINATGSRNLTELEGTLLSGFVRNDTFVFIRIDGTFPEMKVRSVPAQSLPYPPLTEVVKKQAVFDYQNITGTLVGLWSPGYAGTLSYSGFHFHFISEDRSKGGHVLDFETGGIQALIDYTDGIEARLN
ncbi:MAG TPA: acetolactate decarboxylase [Methanomassiliicoccales archaeon]|jgi:acetolactate decarboxylase